MSVRNSNYQFDRHFESRSSLAATIRSHWEQHDNAVSQRVVTNLPGRLSRLSGTWWSLRAITSLSMLFAPSHFDWNLGTPYWSTGTGLVFLQYTDVVTPFCIFYIFAEALHLLCSGGYTLLLSRNLIDGFLYNNELMEKDCYVYTHYFGSHDLFMYRPYTNAPSSVWRWN